MLSCPDAGKPFDSAEQLTTADPYSTVCLPRVVRYRMSTTRGTVPYVNHAWYGTVVCVPMHMTDMSISMLRMQLYVCV